MFQNHLQALLILSFFPPICVFFHEHSRFTSQQGRGKAVFLIPPREIKCIGWTTTFMSQLMLPVFTWTCWISYTNRYAQMLALPLAVSRDSLVLHLNLASFSLFQRYYFSRCSLELTELVSLLYSRRRSFLFSNRLHKFLSPSLGSQI